MRATRRTALTASILIGPALAFKPALAASGSGQSIDLLRPEDDPEFGPIIRGGPASGTSVGTGGSRHAEIRTAFKLLLDAPRKKSVVDTARYFEKIRDLNEDHEAFNQEWKIRSNPLITGFFALTGTAPTQGDQTSWCAAFVSFCLYLANKQNKYTALSGGYRTYSAVAENPLPGDIAVFAERGTNGQKGFGHVGFFLKEQVKNGVEGLVVLGGNQRGDTGSTGAVTEAWFPKEGNSLVLHSIRRTI